MTPSTSKAAAAAGRSTLRSLAATAVAAVASSLSLSSPAMCATSPAPSSSSASTDAAMRGIDEEAKAQAKRCVDASVAAGAEAAFWAALIATPPTLIVCRTVPWAKANLNHTAQALIISASAIAAYFITSEKTLLDCAHRNSRNAVEQRRLQRQSQQ